MAVLNYSHNWVFNDEKISYPKMNVKQLAVFEWYCLLWLINAMSEYFLSF